MESRLEIGGDDKGLIESGAAKGNLEVVARGGQDIGNLRVEDSRIVGIKGSKPSG